MKELVYKTVEGNNPRKKEISIEEIDNHSVSYITRKWTCKYFIKSYYRSRSPLDLRQWLREQKLWNKNTQKCHILKKINVQTCESKLLCKVIGEFYVVKETYAFKIKYVNVIRIHTLPGRDSG
ncbi:MAG: hypothetical protein KAS86_02500 [Candidatus Omnitrophica bacterium]|nr:hypothetical protein [Candidatus Omnitrophota bacterium]